MADALHFERVAEIYDRGRPGYPAELYDALVQEGCLGPGRRILEIGAGSGQATAALAGFDTVIDAIEPGPGLAAMLRRRLPEVRLYVASFEEVDLPADEYDLVVAATSLNHIDIGAALPAIHAAMRPRSTLAVWWTVYGDPEVRTPFRDRVSQIVGGGAGRVPGPLDTEKRLADLTAGGWFTDPRVRKIRWSIDLGRDQVKDLFTTFPGWAGAPARIREAADAVLEVGRPGPLGPLVTEHYVTVLYVLTRADQPSGQDL